PTRSFDLPDRGREPGTPSTGCAEAKSGGGGAKRGAPSEERRARPRALSAAAPLSEHQVAPMRDGDTDAVPGLKPGPFVLRTELGAKTGFNTSDVWLLYAARSIGTSPTELRGPIARTAVSSVDGAFALFERAGCTLAQLEAAIGDAVRMKAICVLVCVPPSTSYKDCAADDDAASSARAQFSVPVLYIKNRDGAVLLTALRSHGRSGYAALLPKAEEQAKGGSFFGSILSGMSSWLKPVAATPESQLFSLLRELGAQPVTESQIQLALGYIGRWEADGAELQQPLINVAEALEKRCQTPDRSGDPGLLLITHKFRELAADMAAEAAAGPERNAGNAACSKLDRAIKACVLFCDFGVRLRSRDDSGGRGFALTVFVNRMCDNHPEWADELGVCALDVLGRSSEMTELCTGLWMRLVTSPLASAGQWEPDLRFFSNKALTASGRHLRADQVYFFLEACAPYALPAAVHALAIAVNKPLASGTLARCALFLRDAEQLGDSILVAQTEDLLDTFAKRCYADEQSSISELLALCRRLKLPTGRTVKSLAEKVAPRNWRHQNDAAAYIARILAVLEEYAPNEELRCELLSALLRAQWTAPVCLLCRAARAALSAPPDQRPTETAAWIERVVEVDASSAPSGDVAAWLELARLALQAAREGTIQLARGEQHLVLRFVRAWFSSLPSTYPPADALSELLEAVARWSLFPDKPPALHGLGVLAEELVAELARSGLNRELISAHGLRSLRVGVPSSGKSNALHSALLDALIGQVLAQQPLGGVKKHVVDYAVVRLRAPVEHTTVVAFAARLLERHCYEQWWPVDLADLLKLDPVITEVLARVAELGVSEVLVAQCEQLVGITEQWRFAAEEEKRISLDELDEIITTRDRAYRNLRRLPIGVLLPEPTQLRAWSLEISGLHGDIMSECSLGSSSQQPPLTSSQPPPLTVLSIFDEYASRLPHHVDAACRSAQDDSWRGRAWSELVAERDALRSWRRTCDGKLQLFAHFSERGSVLFKEQVRKARAEAEAETGSAQWTTEELFDAGDRAILSLERLVDPDRVSFDDVRACVGATKEASVERELQAIVDWPPLAHLAANIDACIQNVSTQVALLCLAVPLDAFTNCLEQYRFACATGAALPSAPRTGPVAKGKAEEDMLTAAKLGDHDALLKALEAGADVRATDHIGYTALHWAAEGGRLGDIHSLLSAASPLDEQSTFNDTFDLFDLFVELALFGSTPLILAASMGRDDCVNALLAAGASAAVATSQGKTALQVATEKRDNVEDKEKVARLDKCIALLSAPASATAGGDPDFHFLRTLAMRLLDESAMSSRTMAECRDDLCRAARLLGDSRFGGSTPSAGLDASTMRHLALFAKLSSATHVVELVGDQGWYDAAGLLRFRQDYGNVTNLLQGEDYQVDKSKKSKKSKKGKKSKNRKNR
ncbi:hypothetical protein T492DRAFT_54504, partial [Pavlovales sp. CCMP2436]